MKIVLDTLALNLARVQARHAVTPHGGARAVPAGGGSSLPFPGGFGQSSGRHYDRLRGLDFPLDWDRRHRVTPGPAWLTSQEALDWS